MHVDAQHQSTHRGLCSKGTWLSDFYTKLGMGVLSTAQQKPHQCQAYRGQQSLNVCSNLRHGLAIWKAVDTSKGTCKRTEMPCKVYLVDMLLVQAGNDQ